MNRKTMLAAGAAAAAVLGIIGIISSRKEENSGVKTFTAFFFYDGKQPEADNEIMHLIVEKTGARCLEQFSRSGDRETIINDFIAEGEYPDYISGTGTLYEAGALVPLDDYIEECPNLKDYVDRIGDNLLRQPDGHIYWIPQFSVAKNAGTEFIHDGEAFWIQTRVLKWAGYPQIRTLDDYFDLLERYSEANPYMEDGTEVIPYTILCDDWRYFCMENVPQFLDGYPNDGSCIVDPDTARVIDYNTTPTAEAYFRKLNEEYQKGIIDPESFTTTYDEYIAKLRTGAVLGMVDQRWDFYYGIVDAYADGGTMPPGCEYVPLPVTISEEVCNRYHVRRTEEVDTSTGIAVTVSCRDVRAAVAFINDLLSEEVMKLRYWGVENIDYEVAEDGTMYVADAKKSRSVDPNLVKVHYCNYPYFPSYEGLMDDGINSYLPESQSGKLLSEASDEIRECFAAYGVSSYVEMLGSNEKPGNWYPMYSYTEQLTYSSPEGSVFRNLTELKHRMLPEVIMAENFDVVWAAYIQAYQACDPQIYLDGLQEEVYRRMEENP